MMKRLIFIDNLKLHLIILVILHHIAVAYGGSGSWPLKEKATDSISPILFTLFTGINQSFFMSLFFLLSGYFVYDSLQRKGALTFIKDRFVRLGIPLALYPIIIAPIIHYLVIRYQYGYTGTFLGSIKIVWDVGPLWFLEILLIFSVIYVVLKPKLSLFKDSFPPARHIILSMIIIAIITFIVRIFFPVDVWIHVFMFAHFTAYAFMFFIGIAAYKNNWLDHIEKLKNWKYAASAFILLLPLMMLGVILFGNMDTAPFLGGLTWQSLVFAFWDITACFSIILALLYLYKSRFDKQPALARWLSPNYYGAYIFHQLVIIAVMVPLLQYAFPSTLKALIVAIAAILLSFILTALIRMIPFTKKVLG
jgi:glucans biosynthesis protein C